MKKYQMITKNKHDCKYVIWNVIPVFDATWNLWCAPEGRIRRAENIDCFVIELLRPDLVMKGGAKSIKEI